MRQSSFIFVVGIALAVSSLLAVSGAHAQQRYRPILRPAQLAEAEESERSEYVADFVRRHANGWFDDDLYAGSPCDGQGTVDSPDADLFFEPDPVPPSPCQLATTIADEYCGSWYEWELCSRDPECSVERWNGFREQAKDVCVSPEGTVTCDIWQTAGEMMRAVNDALEEGCQDHRDLQEAVCRNEGWFK